MSPTPVVLGSPIPPAGAISVFAELLAWLRDTLSGQNDVSGSCRDDLGESGLRSVRIGQQSLRLGEVDSRFLPMFLEEVQQLCSSE